MKSKPVAEPAPDPIVIDAVVDTREHALLGEASEQLSECLGAAFDCPFPVRLAFRDTVAALGPRAERGIVVTSMLTEVDGVEPLPAVEARWREALRSIDGPPSRIVLCTVFRHVSGGSAEPAFYHAAAALRERIRRLGMIAITLSHELATGIADVDRMLAHFGGRALDTDYRLRGPVAACIGGNAVAAALLTAIEDVLDPSAVERARVVLGPSWEIGARVRRRLDAALTSRKARAA